MCRIVSKYQSDRRESGGTSLAVFTPIKLPSPNHCTRYRPNRCCSGWRQNDGFVPRPFFSCRRTKVRIKVRFGTKVRTKLPITETRKAGGKRASFSRYCRGAVCFALCVPGYLPVDLWGGVEPPPFSNRTPRWVRLRICLPQYLSARRGQWPVALFLRPLHPV